jgi:hypothetical protein
VKRRLLALTLIATIAVATLWGNQLVGKILDQKLAPLLSEVLELPVTLGPLKVNLLTLRASSPSLVLGEAANPSIVAKEVQVKLSWSSLLRGEIRLAQAQATDLMVNISRWPGNDNPWPSDYLFLDQWLPNSIQVQTAQYVGPDIGIYPLTDASWERHLTGAASFSWTRPHAAGQLTINGKLHSLKGLLELAEFKLAAALSGTDISPDENHLQLSIEPEGSGYTIDSTLQLSSLQFDITASNSRAWEWPAVSKTTLDKLSLEEIPQLRKRYSGSDQDLDIEAFLASELPQLDLPPHQGELAITRVYFGDQYATNNSIKFNTTASGIKLDEVTSHGPAGHLTATGKIVQADTGWHFDGKSTIAANSPENSIGEALLKSDWHWQTGSIDIAGAGQTWGELLDSSEGNIELAGNHDAAVKTPVAVSAVLGHGQDAFSLEAIKVDLGDSHITGRISLPGGQERRVKMELEADQLNLDFLFQDSDRSPSIGIAVPTFLSMYPGLDLDWEFKLGHTHLPGMTLASAQATLFRDAKGGHLTLNAAGTEEGVLGAKLGWKTPPHQPDNVTLAISMQALSLEQLFQQRQGLFNTRSTGTIQLSSQGTDVVRIFEAMQGQAEVTMDLRHDGDWQRPAKPAEQLSFSGDADLVVEKKQILGVKIGKLHIAAIEQDVTGDVSMVAGRRPWLRAELQSHKINITHLQSLLPESEEQADQVGILGSMRKMGAFQLRFTSDELIFSGAEFSDVLVDVSSGADLMEIKHLDFSLENGSATSSAKLSWQGDEAVFSSRGEAHNLVLDHFFQRFTVASAVPLQGSFEISGKGGSIVEIGTHLSGKVDLKAVNTAASPDERRELQITLARVADGVEAEVQSLVIGRSTLKGSVRYTSPAAKPPLLEIKLAGGDLYLNRWENAKPTAAAKQDDSGSLMSRTAQASSAVVHDVLTAPVKLLEGAEDDADGDGESTATDVTAGNRIISEQPLQVDFLKRHDLHIEGKLDSLTSRVIVARNMELTVINTAGNFSGRIRAPYVNSGSVDTAFAYDLSRTPAPLAFTTTVIGVHEAPDQTTNSRTGFVSVTSQGASPAELAANLNGQIYAELGRGPLDYGGVSFLTADVARSMFRTLIPGAAKQTPEMQCAVTMAVFLDGTGITPYGYAAQTRSANLLGRIEADLAKETIRVAFNSRSREGVGLSIGNMFSNSIRIQGPLNKPAVVPNTTAILWRGWAAFATAGLSMVGEGVLNRSLTSKDPCGDIQEEIRKEVCTGDTAAAASSLVCPSAGQLPVESPQDVSQVDQADTSN